MAAKKKATVKTTATSKKPVAPKPVVAKPTGPWADAFAPRAEGERRYWLVKSEPSVFSFDDLLLAAGRTTCWDGVRNFAARNFLRDGMKRGDRVFYYHSMAEPQAIVGICEVVREGYPAHTATQKGHSHFDPMSDPSNPTWFMVDVRAVDRLPRPVTLKAIKANAELSEMTLLRIGRLSVTPVAAAEWGVICGLGGANVG